MKKIILLAFVFVAFTKISRANILDNKDSILVESQRLGGSFQSWASLFESKYIANNTNHLDSSQLESAIEDIKTVQLKAQAEFLQQIQTRPPNLEPRFQQIPDSMSTVVDKLHSLETILWNQMISQGIIINRFHLANRPFDFPITLLAKGTQGTLSSVSNIKLTSLPGRFSVPVHLVIAKLPSGVDYTEDLTVQFTSDLPEERRTIKMTDESGSQLHIISQNGKPVLQTMAGVNVPETTSVKVLVLQDGEMAKPIEEDDVVVQPATSIINLQLKPQVRPLVVSSSQGLISSNLWSSRCNDFIDKDGNYGIYGIYIYLNNTPDSDPALFGQPGDMDSLICPNYRNFNQDQKSNFLVWYAAAVAMSESGCDGTILAKGVYGTAAGLWQLYLGRTQDFYCGISESGGFIACPNFNAIGDPSLNVKVGLDMLNAYTQVGLNSRPVTENSDHALFWSRNYWQTMHLPSAGAEKTLRLIRQFQACQAQ